jgi:GntP family gluconate:H+ symporter
MITGTPLLLCILLSIIVIVILSGKYKVHPFIALIGVSMLLGIIVGMPLQEVLSAISGGFGSIMAYIGLIVVLGSIIGVYLEKSGGALKIAETIVALAGKSRSVLAMSLMGAVISIPVFCDSGYILLSSLCKKMSKLTSTSSSTLSLALATGLYTTHTLVPPTPGPLAAAGNIGASAYLGTIIIMGLLMTIPVLWVSKQLSIRLSKNIIIEDSTPEEKKHPPEYTPELWHAMIPVLLPVILIGAGTILSFAGVQHPYVAFICAPLTAMFIGTLTAMWLLPPQEKGTHSEYLSHAIAVAGPILIITGAGGAFGEVLKATPIGDVVSQWIGSGQGSEMWMLCLLFLIAALLKSAQGSSTNAMIIASSLLTPLIPILGWDSPIELSLAIMVIGGGAMTVSHVNDSYFWVVTRFSGMKEDQSLRSFSIITGAQGLTILILSLLLSLVM